MTVYTNLAWPDDPYRTGQQLYRRPMPRLAAFTAGRRGDDGPGVVAAAMAYLPLHRTRAVRVSQATLAFGFRAATADDKAGAPALAVAADLDLMMARRHAAVLTGHFLPGDLATLQASSGRPVLRGVAGVQLDWPGRQHSAPGRAMMFDCLLDLPGDPSLDQACQHSGISLDPDSPVGPDQFRDGARAAARTVQRALAIALICARYLGRYRWEGTLHTGPVLAASVWDCFLPSPPVATTTVQARREPARPTARPR